MAKPSKLLEAYERMVAAEEEKHSLMQERLVTLVADKPWNRTIPNCRVRCLSSQSLILSQTMVLRLAMESRLQTMCPSYHLQERSKGTPHMSDIPSPDTPQPDIPVPPKPDIPIPLPEVEPDPARGLTCHQSPLSRLEMMFRRLASESSSASAVGGVWCSGMNALKPLAGSLDSIIHAKGLKPLLENQCGNLQDRHPPLPYSFLRHPVSGQDPQ